METIKPLDQMTQWDDRNRCFPSITLAYRHKQAADLELPKEVPEDLCSTFAIARTLWLYGWFYWPFYHLASFEAYRCIEMALKIRCKKDGIRQPRGLRKLFNLAVESGWLSDADFEHVRRHRNLERQHDEMLVPSGSNPFPRKTLPSDHYVKILQEVMPNLRNRHVHPDGSSVTFPDNGLLSLETARDIIQKLFQTV